MWVVTYWAKDAAGEYLQRMKFDCAKDARAFARKVKGSIETRAVFQ